MALNMQRLKGVMRRIVDEDRTWVRALQVGAALVTILAFVLPIALSVAARGGAEGEETSGGTEETDEPEPATNEHDTTSPPADRATTSTTTVTGTDDDSGGSGHGGGDGAAGAVTDEARHSERLQHVRGELRRQPDLSQPPRPSDTTTPLGPSWPPSRTARGSRLGAGHSVAPPPTTPSATPGPTLTTATSISTCRHRAANGDGYRTPTSSVTRLAAWDYPNAIRSPRRRAPLPHRPRSS